MPTKESYWERQEGHNPNVLEILIHNIKPDHVYGFVKGCEAILSILEEFHTDTVIYPERGAIPISWVVSELSNTTPFEFDEIHLPIGTHQNINKPKYSGLNGNQKKIIIDKAIEQIISRFGLNIKLAIVDEVQSGSTLSQASHHILNSLRSFNSSINMLVIAAQDNREGVIHRNKTQGFRIISANERSGITAAVIPMPLFTVDRDALLNDILFPSDAPEKVRLHAMKICHNTDSEYLFRLMTDFIQHPEKILMLIHLLEDNFTHMPCDGNLKNQCLFLFDLLTRSDKDTRSLTLTQTIQWFKNLYRKSI